MHNIDSIIANVSGQNNYMDALTKLTGNIMFCDIDIYKTHIANIINYENSIKEIIAKYNPFLLSKTELNNYFNDFLNESASLDLHNKSITLYVKKLSKKAKQRGIKPKDPREVIADRYLPRDLIKTKWFSSVKQLEKTSRKIKSKLDYVDILPLEENWEKINKSFMENSNRDLITWNDYIFNEINDLSNMIEINKMATNIIENLLQPMYNYRQTIEKNWHLIGGVFNRNTPFAPSVVQSILSKFVVAKYRCELFNTGKYYIRLFDEILNSPEMMDTNGDLDGVKFMEIVDSIDLNQFDKSTTTYKFINAAAPIMRKLMDPNCDESPEEIIQQINDTLKLAPTKEITENESQEENKDLFA